MWHSWLNKLFINIFNNRLPCGWCWIPRWRGLCYICVFWFWRHLSQSSIWPSIYCSSIVTSRSNPFLEPTSTKQIRVKFLAQGNNRGETWLWVGWRHVYCQLASSVWSILSLHSYTYVRIVQCETVQSNVWKKNLINVWNIGSYKRVCTLDINTTVFQVYYV